MLTRYLSQDDQFIDEMMKGRRSEAPIIVTTVERMSNYPGKNSLLGLYDMIAFQKNAQSPMNFFFRKHAGLDGNVQFLDHSDLVDRVDSSNDILASEKDQFISINLQQMAVHYFTHLLLSLEAEAGVKISMDEIFSPKIDNHGYPLFQSKLDPQKTWDAVKWSPFFTEGFFIIQFCFQDKIPT